MFLAEYGPILTYWATWMSLLGDGFELFELVSEIGKLLIPFGQNGFASILMLWGCPLPELGFSELILPCLLLLF